MVSYLNIEQSTLKANNAYWTAREISQQPETWSSTIKIVEAKKNNIELWLQPILAKKNLRIILTGAGSSAYIGKTLAPHLTQALSRTVEAISTTELVSNPEQYLLKHDHILMVSFARSGNSPESVAAYQLANQRVDNCSQLVISCNKNGELKKIVEAEANNRYLLMPDESLDQSFAMTSSFTSMMLSCLWLFAPDQNQLNLAIKATKHLLEHSLEAIKQQSTIPFKRMIYLGSGSLRGVATEAALKMLELTAGQIDCYPESPLGFRHGPKFAVDENTLVILLDSSHPYRKQYSDDLFNELLNDKKTTHIYRLNNQTIFDNLQLDDIWLSLPYITYCQLLAFYKATNLNITPDNPCPSGEVNRVVQGVTIYPYED